MVVPSRVLEINVTSAHDLALVSKNMKTYVTAWVDSDRKLTTRIDQTGLNNPFWDEKFMFRVDDTFLTDENSAIMIEIYAVAWLKDVVVGSVRVLISHLFGSLSNNSSAFVALQVRRPSGRPQGILNMGITLLDNTRRSLPLSAEMCSDISSMRDPNDERTNLIIKATKNGNGKLHRSMSDRTDLTSEDWAKNRGANVGSMCNGSMVNGNNNYNYGSIVNGSLVSTDVGPSASVVAAAIAKGLYKTPTPAKNKAGEVVLLTDDLTREEDHKENLKMTVARWRHELPPIYDNSKLRANSKRGGRASRRTDGGGLFSCFGNAFGCEVSISCGGGGAHW
ncbi:uncharacterized protein LOC123221819 [Mangifera indica]|uniref:uncharacterized protein LOC123221819 n=1 Tax=Mangifera indica TaxID=29780 RepID=UPI001CFA41D3|nr:uncharacterized protein LOC123221819 [Mangifera indica]